MNLTRNCKRNWAYLGLAFGIPVFGLLTIMLIGGYSPFGNYSMLYSDMYHQYFPFFMEFRRSLLSGDSLLYNWSVGMGVDYLGLYAYYLASPLNLLSVLVPESWLLGYFSLLVPIKLGLASLFFAIFLKKIFRKNGIEISLFGSFYGLCAWALGYQWNVMWLDTFALLPLVMLGMVSLLQKRRFVLYTITLFLSVAINYYVGFFTCIFVFLTFICYEICRWENFKKFLIDLGLIAVFSLLAIGMTAFLSLPTLAALGTTQSSVNAFPKGWQLNMTNKDNWKGLFETMFRVAGNTNGGIAPTFKEGLPNLYCGIFANLLAILYLFCGQVRTRDKICAVGLLLFFNISFIVRQLDYVWHGFHFPNMIPYRFSFLHSFVVLYMAFAAWTHRKHFQIQYVLIAAAGSILLTFLWDNIGTSEYKIASYFVYNLIPLVLYCGILIYMTYRKRQSANTSERKKLSSRSVRIAITRMCSFQILLVISVELVLNLLNFGVSFPPTDASNYPKGTSSAKEVIAYMKQQEEDNLFYRAEATRYQTLNDGALNGYNGITTFTSSANVKVTEFMQALGYAAKDTYNRYAFAESSPVTNLFLGLKYMIERDGAVEKNSYFDEVYRSDNVVLLENNAYLPLGFLADSKLKDKGFYLIGNRFTFQNELMRAATGMSENVWHLLPGSALKIHGSVPTLTSAPSSGYCSYTSGSSAASVTYSYTADRNGLMCIHLDLSKKNNFSVWVNGVQLYNETYYSLPQMCAVSDVKVGDLIQVKLNCKANETGSIKIAGAILDEELFWKGYDILAASTLELTSFSNTRVTGTINCNRDGLLYTSIPQNGNWQAYVDGEPASIQLVGNVMIGLELTEGEHSIEFVYRNPAFTKGLIISIGCLLLFGGAYVWFYRPFFKKER